MNCDIAGRRPGHTGNDPQQRALPGTIFANNSQTTASFHCKVNIAERPKRLMELTLTERQQLL